MRKTTMQRATKETDIVLTLALDGSRRIHVATGIGFFDHMLTAFAFHAGFDLDLMVEGDLYVDGHHTVEDAGIVLGKALGELLADRSGIARYGSAYVPMDEALGFCALDISGRPYLVYDCPLATQQLGNFETELAVEWFRAVAYNAGITLHLRCLYGANAHHKLEALFKAFGQALRQAVAPTADGDTLSTKGVLA